MQYPNVGKSFWCCLLVDVLLLIPCVQAGISHTLGGPSSGSICDTLTFTNTIDNTGGVLSGLMVTNSLPGGSFNYVAGQTVITLPGSVTRSGTNADPDAILGGTNLVWDFSNLATPCEVTHVLISEVYYNDSHTTMENKYGYQWVELFNPTADPITLNGWKLWDATPGVSDDLPTMTLAPGEFVIVAGSTNAFKAGHGSYSGQLFQVSDGAIGNGLNDYGDGVFLYQGATQVDGMSYGNSTAAFPLPCQLTMLGYSLARYPAANADTGTRSDWATLTEPTPGTGSIPTGLQSGKGVTIIYKVAGSCSAATGQFVANAGYQQPPGTPMPVSSATKSVTLYAGDLLVSETPLMQDAGRYDTVGWTVTVKNLGLGNAKNVVVADRLSSGFQFVSSDKVPTSTNSSLGTLLTWDSAGVPELAELAPDASVSIAISGRVVSNVDLSNKADVQWGCSTSTVCQSSVSASNTVTAGINLVDRVPRLSAWLTPASPVWVPYCSATNVVLHVTNGSDTSVGTAFDVAISNIWPAGFSGVSQVLVGDIPRGGSTNISIGLQAGGECPISTNSQTAYFTFNYHDSMDRVYGPPTLYSVVKVVQPPSASVQVSVPVSQTSTAGGVIPVKIFFTYNNFVGTEEITLRDTYPASTNLSLADISGGGYTSGTDVVWTNSGFVGSGVYTASFNLVIGSLCGGPVGYIKNTITVPGFTNCRGCATGVSGSGEEYLTYLGAGEGCSTWEGGTGSCHYVSYKTTPTNLVEVCHPVFLSHSFTNFSGALPGWTNMSFTSDLGGGGDLTDTNDVRVWVNGSNLTSFCTVSDIGSLSVNLSGLTNSLYASPSAVTNLTITWWMQTLEPGRVEETSTLHMPVCGGASATVYWNVGASVMTIALQPIEYLEACGVTTGRIDLTQLSSPGLLSGSNAVFAAYDVRVTLNLDSDGDLDSDLSYETDSTVFSNMVMWGGSTTNGFNPTISSNRLTWSLGNLDTKGGCSIFYVLRGACSRSALEKQVATVAYSSYCASTQWVACSLTNPVPVVCPAGRLSVGIQPEVTFLTDTQYVVRLSFMNTGAGTAYNVTPELIVPTNVVFSSASIMPSSVTATSVVWTLQYASNPGNLTDADGDGKKDDLVPLGQFEILVTNTITAFGQNAVHASVSHGCNNSTCQSAVSANATFESNAGALAARTSFAASGTLCNTNGVQILVLNTGLIKDFNIHIFEVLPEGMTYVAGSSRYVYGGVTNNALMDPTGVGTIGDKLNWGRDQIPILAGLPTSDQVTILFSTLAACGANAGNKQYSTTASYYDIGQNLNAVAAVSAIQTIVIPVLSVNVAASHTVIDHNRTNVYTITVDHSAGSTVDVPAMRLVDTLPTGVDYLGASVLPDAIWGQTLVWSNSTLMALVPGGAPYAPGDAAISITVTGLVRACNYIDNTATIYFGCDPDSLCLNAANTQTSISVPIVTVNDLSPLTLNSWGGTRTIVVTNTGATGRGIIISNVAPAGFVFTAAATVTGELSGTPLVQLSGSPSGKYAIVDFNSTASSGGIVDEFDDAEDGIGNLDVGNGKGFVLTLNLINDGSGMDTLANPLDSGYVDPEPVVVSEVTAIAVLTYSNLCVEISPVTDSQSAKTIPIRPDPDIDLLPHSLLVTNGQTVNFTLSVKNAADAGLTTNLYVRLKFGAGWSNLSCVSTNIQNSGSGTLQMEMIGNSNVLINLPGYALNPTDSEVAMTFQATAIQGAGALYALAEVVGESPVAAAVAYVGTNTLGAAPLLDTMQGTTISTNHGTYYGFDQVEGLGAGFEVNGTISYAVEGAPHVNQLTARIGEPLVFHLSASFFGTAYSNIVLTQSHENNFIFGTPTAYVYAGGITNAVYDSVAGTFTLQPMLVDTDALSQLTVDVPVWVRNSLANQAGMSLTNIIMPSFTVVGVTNLPPNSTNVVCLVEPTLALAMTCNTNNVQAGDIVTFTNVITHSGSTTNAYDIVFSNILPDGMTFDGVVQDGTWTASGSVLALTGDEIPGLTNLAVGSSLTIVVKAKVMNQLVGSTISNGASIYYTSLPGSAGYERDGSGGIGELNDYTTSARVGVLAIPLTGIRKSVGVSSEDYTTPPNLTIGERILYTIHVDVPNGVSTNLQIIDHLPPGLDWVGSNTSAGLTYPGYGYQFSIPSNGPVFSTNEGSGLTITDSDSTRGDSMTLDGSGSSVCFTIAVITNTPDGNDGNDNFDLTLQCVVLNDATNTNGKIWSNQVTVADGFSSNTTNSVAYTIVEPILTIGHALSPVASLDAGDLVTVTLFVTNSAAALASAYDLIVLDSLPVACFDPATLVMETPETGWGITTNVVGANLEYRFATLAGISLPPHTVITNRFTVRLAQGVSPNQVISNAVELLASDTINGETPEGIPSRSTTVAKTYLSLTVTNVGVEKTFSSKSETNSTVDAKGQNVQIGETVSYKLEVRVPEGTVSNLVVTDLIPRGMQYVANRVETNSFAGVLGSPMGVSSGGNGVPVSFVFSNATVVTADNEASSNKFAIYVDAVVLNVAGNTGKVYGAQTLFTNKAVVSFAANPLVAVTNGAVMLTNVEPVLAISKTISTNVMDAGDTVTVTLTITNTGLAAAYDLVVTDVLNTVYFDTNTVTGFTVSGGKTPGYSWMVSNATVWIQSVADNAVAPTNSLGTNEGVRFTFDVKAAQRVPPNTAVTNRAGVYADTIAGVAANQRTVTGNVATARVTIPNISIAKSFVGSSQTNAWESAATNLQIGETATYRIDVNLPEGTVSNLVVTDLIPVGMQYVTNRVDTGSFAGTLGSPLGVITNSTGVSLVFSNNTVVTSNNAGSDNAFSIYVDAMVLDVAGNTGRVAGVQTVFTNRATATFAGPGTNTVLSSNVYALAIEPVLAISKTISTNVMDAGDWVTVTLTVTNTGLAGAYDLVVTDVLNTVYFDTNTVTGFTVSGGKTSGYSWMVSNATVWIQSVAGNAVAPTNSLGTNEGVRFTFDVRAAQIVPPNTTVTNLAGAFADTMAGSAMIQRTVSAGVATALISIPNISIAKSFVGSSQTNAWESAATNLQIGETATYRIDVNLPEGTVSNLVVTDLIPVGMQYVTNRVDTGSFAGTLGSPLGVITNSTGVSLVFSNNTVVTSNNVGSDNAFSIYVDAMVLDVVGNTGRVAGVQTVFTNRATATFAGPGTNTVLSSDVHALAIEPVLAITKTLSTNVMDAGDWVTVTLTVTNTGLAGAYDLAVTDVLNTVYFDTNTVTGFTVSGGKTPGYSWMVSNATVWIRSVADNAVAPTNSLGTNEGVRFTFDVRAAQTVPPNTTVTNRAGAFADTMAGSALIQRTVSAGVATALMSIPNIAIAKSLVGTSQTNAWESAATNLQIGETATYRIDVTLPEGTIPNLVVTDLIPAGMQYVTNRLVSHANMTLGTVGVTGGGGYGVPVVITFAGDTVVLNNNLAADNILGIEVDAVVLNTNLNSGLAGSQTVFTNKATATFSGPGSGTVTSANVYTWAVEPSLRMIKTMSGPVNGLVTISLVVTNAGLATAYDVVVTDRLDSAFFQTSTLINTSLPDGFTLTSNGVPGSATLTLASGSSSMLPTNAIRAGEAVSFTFTALSVPNAGRSITNVAVIVSNSTLSGVSVNERQEPVVCGTNVLALPMSMITKTVVSPVGRPADVGETVTYQIAVTNLGSLGMSSVLVSDVYPTNYLSYLSAVAAPQTVLAGGTLVWSNMGPIAVGGGTNITVNFRAIHNTYPGVMTNLVSSAVVTTNGASPALISGSVTNAIVPSYALSKAVIFPVGRSAVTSGPAYFVMTVTNSGDLSLSTVQLADTYDSGVLQYSSASPTPSSASSGSLVWNNIGSIPVGGTASVTGRFVALTSTGNGKTTNTVMSTATFQGIGLTTARTNEALLQVTIPVGLSVVVTNPTPSGSNITFEINTVSGAVYHVISVSNNIDHPSGQNWRLMVTWSNMPNWVTYTDTNVVAEVSNTRFYLIVWDEAGITQTNSVMYEAFVQNLTTGWWHELAMPVECFDYELNKTMGAKLKVGLRGDNADGDLLFALRDDGTWQTYRLYGNNKWVRDGEVTETTDRISPKAGYWVKRLTGGVSTNVEYVGPVRLTSETNTFLPGKWKMISWPFPRSRTEDFGTNKGWGFAAAGAHGDMNWENADRLYVSSGLTTIILYMRPDGRWYKVGQDVPAGSSVRLQHGVGYYYYHSGTGFVWAAESPAAGSAWY